MNSLSKDIIDLLNKKEDTAFDLMYRMYYPRLVFFAKQYVTYEVAKESVQDAFIKYLESTLFFSNEAQLRSYLYTMVKNNCLMELRHEKVKTRFIEKSEASNLQNLVYQSALEKLDTSEVTFKEMELIINNTIESLPPRCREIFILSRHEGMKNREIAVDLDISLKTVEAQITNALKIFRIALKDFLPFLTLLFI